MKFDEDGMAYTYLVRFGLTRQVGRFIAEQSGLARGEEVVIRSHRGTELGEVIVEGGPGGEAVGARPDRAGAGRLLRVAGADDLDRARRAERQRPQLFEACRRVFLDGVWPLELIDVEPLLDERRAVLHYFGPHHLDAAGLIEVFRATQDLDVVLDPAGKDLPWMDEGPAELPDPGGCGSCGSGGGCGAGTGTSHGGCSDCGIKKWIAAGKAAPR